MIFKCTVCVEPQISMQAYAGLDQSNGNLVQQKKSVCMMIDTSLSVSKLDAHCQSRMWGHLCTEHSIVRGILSTWMYIFDKTGKSWPACLHTHAQ